MSIFRRKTSPAGMQVLVRRKCDSPIHVLPGDSITVEWYRDPNDRTVIERHKIDASQAMVVTEVIIFTTVFEGRRAIGGMFVEG